MHGVPFELLLKAKVVLNRVTSLFCTTSAAWPCQDNCENIEFWITTVALDSSIVAPGRLYCRLKRTPANQNNRQHETAPYKMTHSTRVLYCKISVAKYSWHQAKKLSLWHAYAAWCVTVATIMLNVRLQEQLYFRFWNYKRLHRQLCTWRASSRIMEAASASDVNVTAARAKHDAPTKFFAKGSSSGPPLSHTGLPLHVTLAALSGARGWTIGLAPSERVEMDVSPFTTYPALQAALSASALC